MSKRTYKKWSEVLKKDTLTENEIITLKRYENGTLGKEAGNDIKISELLRDRAYELDGFNITPEQTTKGIGYLRSKTWKKNNLLRKNNKFGNRELFIINNFSHFKFEGFTAHPDFNYQHVPEYRVVSKNGDSFTYTGVQYDYIRITS